jgi:hypothetical protein
LHLEGMCSDADAAVVTADTGWGYREGFVRRSCINANNNHSQIDYKLSLWCSSSPSSVAAKIEAEAEVACLVVLHSALIQGSFSIVDRFTAAPASTDR